LVTLSAVTSVSLEKPGKILDIKYESKRQRIKFPCDVNNTPDEASQLRVAHAEGGSGKLGEHGRIQSI
jgi:hypothetical protein